jgi:pimeloyl-ACP methyl ester carboxylesterase
MGIMARAVQVTGSGEPVTCFVPGMLQSVTEVRIFGSGVAGSRVFFEHEPHDSYRALSDGVAQVATEADATQALGVSLGAAVLLDLLIRDSRRFERVVLALPAVIDSARPAASLQRGEDLADAIDANDQTTISRLLLELQPLPVRSRADVRLWARRRASELLGSDAAAALRALPRDAPVTLPEDLRRITAPVLVLGQQHDPEHPVQVAERLGNLLPNADVVIGEDAWSWSGRARLRELVGGFLSG